LLARELAPSSRKFRTAIRIATSATIGAGLIASCHVYNQYGRCRFRHDRRTMANGANDAAAVSDIRGSCL
jgi:hypothetical protein